MLFANVCAGFIISCHGEPCEWRFFGFLASPWCLVHMEVPVLLVSLLCTRLGLHWCSSCWTQGEGISFVTSGENAWQLIKLLASIWGLKGSSGCGWL